MKMKACNRVRRVFAALILLCAGTAGMVQAEIPRASLSVGPLFSYGYADIYEYVYSLRNGDWWKLSELDWDVHNTLSAGVTADFSFGRFYFNAGGSAAFPSETGLMQDYDWLYLEVADNDHPFDTLTEFSEHEITLEKKDWFSLTAGYTFFRGKKWSLSPFGGFQHFNTEMMGHDGYLQHSSYGRWEREGYTNDNVHPYDSSREKYLEEGKVISYQLSFDSLWLGVKSDFKILPDLNLSCEVCCSPYQLTDCYDHHYSPGTDNFKLFHDIPESVFLSRAGLSATFSFGRRSSLCAGASVMNLPMALGNDYMNVAPGTYGADPVAGCLGGVAYFGWDVSLSYRIRIF